MGIVRAKNAHHMAKTWYMYTGKNSDSSDLCNVTPYNADWNQSTFPQKLPQKFIDLLKFSL